jgi:DNA-binding transcriptional regulator YiaG
MVEQDPSLIPGPSHAGLPQDPRMASLERVVVRLEQSQTTRWRLTHELLRDNNERLRRIHSRVEEEAQKRQQDFDRLIAGLGRIHDTIHRQAEAREQQMSDNESRLLSRMDHNRGEAISTIRTAIQGSQAELSVGLQEATELLRAWQPHNVVFVPKSGKFLKQLIQQTDEQVAKYIIGMILSN